ncbi:MAG: hypothetical protein FJZ00_02520 [Candidatus Sericytochromatia bacterium]|uniref:Uncharacterized protein n=1 Tax=Candidatus Tanganyikabacteria bacterium TaxID=2961651 RepID=A0A937X442_9BACT|nr:hypothetical protein [Candidatus Tanganyikabacteria bacterium]
MESKSGRAAIGLLALVCAATFALASESVAKSKAQPAPTPYATPHGTKRVEKESKVWKGEKDGKPGYWFQFVNTSFEWQAYVEVVALYRRVTDNWVSDLKSKYLEASRSDKAADVRKVAEKTGYDKLLKYVEGDARSAKRQADSIGIVLLDKNTGEIVCTIPVKNADDASFWMNDAMKGERSVTLKSGAKQDVKLSGYIWHASPIILDLGRLGRPDLLAGPDWGLLPGSKLASAAVRDFDLDGPGDEEQGLVAVRACGQLLGVEFRAHCSGYRTNVRGDCKCVALEIPGEPQVVDGRGKAAVRKLSSGCRARRRG